MPPEMPGPNISVTFCEDIRTEKSEKLLVIGVFVDEMLVNQFPASIRLALWIRIFDTPAAAAAVRIVVTAPGGYRAETEAIVVARNRPQNHVLLPAMPMPIGEAGEIVVQVEDNHGDIVGTDRLPVRMGTVSA
jgi:hypothetical protein